MPEISVVADGPVTTITLDRPARRNAMTYALWAELGEHFRTVSRSTARVVVLTGSGPSFCAGADLDGPDRAPYPGDQLRMVGETCVALQRMPQPTIAKVRGHAVGAGANLALACDLVMAADDAVFHESFVRRGLSVDFGGSWTLQRLVGLRRATEILLTGASITATDAEHWGLINRAVPEPELDAAVDELVANVLPGAPIALAQTKFLLQAAADSDLAAAVDAEARAQTINRGTADAAEGVAAFRERRAPEFRGL
jgi:enoyl-CoA hydratase/carnithine racemase